MKGHMKLSKLLVPATLILTIVAFLAMIAAAQGSQSKPALTDPNPAARSSQPQAAPSQTIAKPIVPATEEPIASKSESANPLPNPLPNPLNDIAWMKGGVWAAEVKDATGAVATRIETRIRGSENGHLIKFTTTFVEHNRPHLQYEGVYLYDPQAKQIEFYYTDSEGNFTRGHAAFAGSTLTQDFDIIHMNGHADTLRSLVVRDGENAYNWNVMSKKSGEWKEILHLRYIREPSEN